MFSQTVGGVRSGLLVSFEADALGLYTGTLTFEGASQNAFQSDLKLVAISIFFAANVVPEPDMMILLGLGLMAGFVFRSRRGHKVS
jgi:hypothetical protein